MKQTVPQQTPEGKQETFGPKDAVTALGVEPGSIISLVDKLVEHAFQLDSSDVHIDPHEDIIKVRFRVDGILRTIFTIPTEIHSEVISRIKVCTNLRTDEHQLPQDGRMQITTTDGKKIDIRVAIAPTYYGENAVLRLLINKNEELSIDSLGFSKEDKEKIVRTAKRTTGMILATGPTGSGKTTTLYSLIKMLNSEDVSITTIEDPIEYSIGGVRQMQVNPRTNLTFAAGFKSILRQDPDIIMVGEIRDSETARMAVNTALTGHLLLSTLHTNDAPTTLPRLLDMEIEPYLVASTVSLAIGQRLVRKICQHCKEEYIPTEGERLRIEQVAPPHIEGSGTFYQGRGCDKCGGTGYKGRININEVLEMNESIREIILRKGSSDEIKRCAVSQGMTTIFEDGILKSKAGLTTISEFFRVIHE